MEEIFKAEKEHKKHQGTQTEVYKKLVMKRDELKDLGT